MWSRRTFLTIPSGMAFFGQPGPAQHAENNPQFRSGTSLVVAPTTVTAGTGAFVPGIPAEQFVLTDNGVRQNVTVEEDPQPLAVILAVQASFEARKPLDRLRTAASLFGPLVIGAGGSAALVAFREDVETVVSVDRRF